MFRKKFIDLYLKNGFEFPQACEEIDFVLSILFDYKYEDYITGKVPDGEKNGLLEKIFTQRVLTHKPIQQLTGCTYFFGRKFYVSENTLIPRPDTEILVSEAKNIIENEKKRSILDIGTGTGCIALTLALETNVQNIDAVDISAEALKIAEKNALYHNLQEKVNFTKSDLFENVKNKYDIIVSNPPYIPLKDRETLQIEVREYDPYTALFTQDEQGIEFYEKILNRTGEFMNDNAVILFEIGINQSGLVKNILENNNFKDIKIIKDFNGIDRVISGRK